MAAPLPPIAPQTPSALFRSAPSGKAVLTIESAEGAMIAPPTPWIPRITIRVVSDSAKPHPSEAAVKTTTPATKTIRLPSRSAARPPSSRKPPKVIA